MVDAHIHYDASRDNTWNDICVLYQMMEENNVEKALLIDIDDDWYISGRHKWDYGDKIVPGFILHPKDEKAFEKLEALRKQGIRFIKYLPYKQNILRSDYGKALELAYQIEQEGMCLIVDAEYGSKNIYLTNGVELTEFLLRNGIKMPIIVAHGGMPKILDLYSLMCEYENVYMDISFTLQFWWGSSIIMDYAYVLKRINYENTFYGSDYPYVSQEESLKYFDMFCKVHDISEDSREKLLRKNFLDFLDKTFK